jgi:glycosyltransferase involved in cell wall biosynthesis
VVHCNDIASLWTAGFGARLAGAAVVFNVRNIKPEDQRYGWRWQVARRISNRQLVLSREMHNTFARRLNLNNTNGHSARIDYIYSAVDRDRFSPIDAPARAQLRQKLGIESNCFAIGYVAPFDKRKAQLEFIREALTVLSQSVPQAKVFFIGDFAPESNDYAKRCREAVFGRSRRLVSRPRPCRRGVTKRGLGQVHD